MSEAYSPVPELNLLKEFEERLGRCCYSQAVELREFGDLHGVETYSADPEFVGSFLGFACATLSGSDYALWRIDDRADLSSLPVVVFGDEGGIFIVARNVRELFQLLGCDRAIHVWDDCAEFDEDDQEHDRETSPDHDEYVAWLESHFGLAPPSHPNELVHAADEELGAQLASWVERFVQDA
ncbi:hypothetical protein ACFW4X_14610 [Streptomyces smyrnaeus]|uniref:hypothetical protein n=1 Tax=Streptomyces smyrnaeus TaxID=1387713 RepID=UPI0036A9CF32